MRSRARSRGQSLRLSSQRAYVASGGSARSSRSASCRLRLSAYARRRASYSSRDSAVFRSSDRSRGVPGDASPWARLRPAREPPLTGADIWKESSRTVAAARQFRPSHVEATRNCARCPERRAKPQAALLLRRGQQRDARPPRRQGCRAGGYDACRPSGAAGLHDHDGGLSRVLSARPADARRTRGRSRALPLPSSNAAPAKALEASASRCSFRCAAELRCRCPG